MMVQNRTFKAVRPFAKRRRLHRQSSKSPRGMGETENLIHWLDGLFRLRSNSTEALFGDRSDTFSDRASE